MRCSCGKKPVYFRRNEGAYYCKSCFCASVERKFRKTVAKYHLIGPKERLAIGLSGGKDSSAVLYLMQQLVKNRKNVSLFAITLDEGIAEYRPETLKKAKQLCKELKIKHHIVSFQKKLGKTLDAKIKKDGEKDFCTFCGVARRYLLNKAARELKATKLCVGHNLDDESQAVLMNYLRGDLQRAGRLGVITENTGEKSFIPRIKPLRFIPEKEVALYALLKGLPFSGDECPYARGIRFDVRDFLNDMENKHPGMKHTILESYDKIAPAIRQSASYKGKIQRCKKCKEPSSQEVCKTCQLWK